jgi:hypothetical protein
MTADERRRYLKAILDQHAEAASKLRQSSDAFDHAMLGVDDVVGGVKRALAAMQEANQVQRDAMDSIIAANRAALALFNDEA